MTSIHTSPWGGVQSATVLAPGATLIETASHGGLHLAGRALEAIPRAVGATFINGPSWAEEDCELAIALAILHAAGIVPSDKLLGLTPRPDGRHRPPHRPTVRRLRLRTGTPARRLSRRRTPGRSPPSRTTRIESSAPGPPPGARGEHRT